MGIWIVGCIVGFELASRCFRRPIEHHVGKEKVLAVVESSRDARRARFLCQARRVLDDIVRSH